MAGYSGTPLPKKLGIKDGSRVALVGAPAGLVPAIADGADVLNSGVADVLVCFVDTVDEVSQRLAELKPRLEWDGGLWFAWRKRRPGFTPTLDENTSASSASRRGSWTTRSVRSMRSGLGCGSCGGLRTALRRRRAQRWCGCDDTHRRPGRD